MPRSRSAGVRRFGWLLGLRYLRLGARSLDLLAADHDVAVHQPFLDPAFVGSLAALQRGRRFRGRTEALLTLFPDLLPREVATRTSKAGFSAALWGEESRALAAAWDGEGVDPEIVDVDALKRRWRTEGRPGPHVLLQSIWLRDRRTSAGGHAEHGIDHVRHGAPRPWAPDLPRRHRRKLNEVGRIQRRHPDPAVPEQALEGL